LFELYDCNSRLRLIKCQPDLHFEFQQHGEKRNILSSNMAKIIQMVCTGVRLVHICISQVKSYIPTAEAIEQQWKAEEKVRWLSI
jgi:hypothetical protein